MAQGYNGKILRVNLSDGGVTVEGPGEEFYRTYFGGAGLVAFYLLKELQPGTDPLGEENKLIYATSALTGVPIAGGGRSTIGAKSPVTGTYFASECGGFFGAELKRAGFDAVIFEGISPRPVYIWIHDGDVEIRDASHLWGLEILEAHRQIKKELGEERLRTSLIGPAGERKAAYATVMNDVNRAHGRGGMGAVMGSKNLKGLVVRGGGRVEVVDRQRLREIAKWLADRVNEEGTWENGWKELGTTQTVLALNRVGGLPTRNFREGVFEGAEKISGERMRDTILTGRSNCYGCPLYCKREVSVDDGEYKASPAYGGPEYETLADLGSLCGIDDLAAISKANEICNANGLDTISMGTVIAFAMECFENGLLTKEDTDGLDLHFGNAGAMVRVVEQAAQGQGFGALVASGFGPMLEQLGQEAAQYAMEVKKLPLPMHDPRLKKALGFHYAMAPLGGDHCTGWHDTTSPLDEEKVRQGTDFELWRSWENCADLCIFIPYSREQAVDIVKAITGWDYSEEELLRTGERHLSMARAFNIREGLTDQDDRLPERFFEPLPSGPLQGETVSRELFAKAKRFYYELLGWTEEGVPTRERLKELRIPWVADELFKWGKALG